jgi:hypothetical protein
MAAPPAAGRALIRVHGGGLRAEPEADLVPGRIVILHCHSTVSLAVIA